MRTLKVGTADFDVVKTRTMETARGCICPAGAADSLVHPL